MQKNVDTSDDSNVPQWARSLSDQVTRLERNLQDDMNRLSRRLEAVETRPPVSAQPPGRFHSVITSHSVVGAETRKVGYY